jgi:hypothetical protein
MSREGAVSKLDTAPVCVIEEVCLNKGNKLWLTTFVKSLNVEYRICVHKFYSG